MAATIAIGVGILVAGLMFVATSRAGAESPSREAAVRTVLRTLAHIVIAVAVAVILASLDASAARLLTLVLGLAGVGWAVIKAAGSQAPALRLIVLGAAFGLSIVVAAVFGALFGEAESDVATAAPVASTPDAGGDCVCDAAFDVTSLGTTSEGSIIVEVADIIPEGATYWLWSAEAPLVPIELTRTGESWLVQSDDLGNTDPAEILITGGGDGFELQLGYPVGLFAVTSAEGDRAPDSGYFGTTGAGEPSEIEERFQRAYAELAVADRTLTRAFVQSLDRTGTFLYDVGISTDPDIAHTGMLVIEDSAFEFTIDASDTRGGHVDRFGGGDPVCNDDALEVCVGMWLDPHPAVEEFLSDASSAEIVSLVGREVLGREAACIAVTEVGSTSLHEGEFCVFSDGTFAFVDDRTAGFVAVLTKVPNA